MRSSAQRFAETHLGAKRMTGTAGTYSYPYIAYRESNSAAFLELCSVLAVIAGLGLMFALHDSEKGFSCVLLRAAEIFLANRLFAVLARIVNNAAVRRRIINDTDYAYRFAAKYPAQAHICCELNMVYAANPDAVSPEELRAMIADEPHISEKLRKTILIGSLSFLGLVCIGLIAFVLWAMHEGI